MKKNCKTCELCIENKCCGRNDIYGQEIKEPIENCEEWEISFEELQKKENALDALTKKLLGEE